jgi:hypothetical protein
MEDANAVSQFTRSLAIYRSFPVIIAVVVLVLFLGCLFLTDRFLLSIVTAAIPRSSALSAEGPSDCERYIAIPYPIQHTSIHDQKSPMTMPEFRPRARVDVHRIGGFTRLILESSGKLRLEIRTETFRPIRENPGHG